MTKDQEIYQKIVKLMWSIMPQKYKKFELYGKVYNYYDEIQAIFFDEDNKKYYFKLEEIPREVFDEIVHLARKLCTLPPYSKEPWTHFMITLYESGKFDFKFAYIPVKKDEPGLFMMEGNTAPHSPEQ